MNVGRPRPFSRSPENLKSYDQAGFFIFDLLYLMKGKG